MTSSNAVHVALASGIVEFGCKTLNLGGVSQKFHGPLGYQLDIWLDYPQSIATGFIALSFFGRGFIGYTTASIAIGLPLVLKICREFNFADPKDLHDYTDVTIRDAETLISVATKAVNVIAAVSLGISNRYPFQGVEAGLLACFLVGRVVHLTQFGF